MTSGLFRENKKVEGHSRCSTFVFVSLREFHPYLLPNTSFGDIGARGKKTNSASTFVLGPPTDHLYKPVGRLRKTYLKYFWLF